MRLWPFESTGNRVRDVKAPKLAEVALRSIQRSGRSPETLRLVYRALELDAFQPHALLVMIELFRGKKKEEGRPKGDEIYAGLLVEYSLDPKNTIPADQKPFFDKMRSDIMKSWGFVQSKGEEVDVDHIGYMGFINNLLGQVQSLTNGFKTAHAKLGVQAGALDPATHKPTPTYQDWLHTDASILFR